MPVYVDANALIYASHGHDRIAWRRALESAHRPCTTFLALDEYVWALQRHIGKAAAVQQARMLLEWPALHILDVGRAVGSRALDLMDTGLDPRDAAHAAAALLHGCRQILSDDADFDAVPGLERLTP